MKKEKTVKIEMIPLSQIVPDENNPRRNFDPSRLAELISSIKNHGIISPLVVERAGTNRYLLVDGERRYRASKEIGLKEVPAIVEEAQNETERLIQQFHIQEQHAGWSGTEKAVAVARLAKELNMNVEGLAKELSLPQVTIRMYQSFYQLLEKHEFEKNEVTLRFARSIVHLRNFVKTQYMEQLQETFDEPMQRSLEKAIITRIKNSSITKDVDLVRLRDAVKSDARSIERFIADDKVSIDQIFLESKAKIAHYHRNIKTGSHNLAVLIRNGMAIKVHQLFDESERNALVKVREELTKLIDSI